MRKKLDLKRHRFSIIAGAVVFFLIFIVRVNIVTTLALSAGAGIIQYLSSKYQLMIDTGHVFFIGVLLGRVADGLTSGIFVLVIGIVPKMIAGDIDPVILIAYFIQSVIVFVSTFFGYSIVIFGVFLTIITFGAIFFMTIAIDFDMAEILDDSIVPGLINFLLFTVVGEFSLRLLSMLYS